MKIHYLLSFLFLSLVFSSCKKDEIKETMEIPPNCPLCAYADSISGTYKGPYFPSGGPDTTFYRVQHIYLNQGTAADSTVMYFKLYRSNSLNSPETFIAQISTGNDNGIFYNNSQDDKIVFRNDSLIRRTLYYDHVSGQEMTSAFDGKKLP